MKRGLILLLAPLFCVACTQSREWTQQRKEQLIDTLQNCHRVLNMNYMEQKEVSQIDQCVVSNVIEIFPQYNEYQELNDAPETLLSLTMDCLEDQMGEEFDHLNKYLDYKGLQSAEILPEGLGSGPLEQFYGAVKSKLKAEYSDAGIFLMALANDPAAPANFKQALLDAAQSINAPKLPVVK